MTAKEYLQQVYHINEKVKRLRKRRDDLRNDLYALGSPTGHMDADKVQSSMTDDKMLRLIARVDELERDLVSEIEILIESKQHIIRQIEVLDDERYKTLLFDRYIMLYRWGAIAADMNYRLKWVYSLHGEALKAFGEKWGSETEKIWCYTTNSRNGHG